MLSKNRQLMKDIKAAPFDIIISLFRYLQSKDIFENFYTRYLAQRLLHRRSESMEREQEFVACIKAECGQQFFNRVEQMYKDIHQSEIDSREYLSSDPRKKPKIAFEVEYFVISQGSWPVPSK